MAELEQLCLRTAALAREVGEFIRQEKGRVAEESIEEKDLNSLVSYVDRQAEQRLVEVLHEFLPEATFLTEEDTIENQDSALQWIIDPLDGTTNFLHQLPCFSVSIGLQREGQTVIGVVYEINQQEAFYAWQGGGAFLNNHPIQASRRPSLAHSLIATGFPYFDYRWMGPYFTILEQFMRRSRGIRRFGSAAVDLAYVACGRYDAFFEYSLNSWDVAGGALIAREAGALVSDFRGGEDYLFGREIIAASPQIYEEVYQLINQAFYPG